MAPIHKIKPVKSKGKLHPKGSDVLHTVNTAKKIPKSKCSVVIFKPHENRLATILTQYLNRVGIQTGKRHEMYKEDMKKRIESKYKTQKIKSNCFVKATKIQKGSTQIVPLTNRNMQQFLSPQMSNSVMLWRPRSPNVKPMHVRIPSGRVGSNMSLSKSSGKISRSISVPSLSRPSWKSSMQSIPSLRSRSTGKADRRKRKSSWERVIAKHSYGSLKPKTSSEITLMKTKKLKAKKKKSTTALKSMFSDLIDQQAREIINTFLKKCHEIRKTEVEATLQQDFPDEDKDAIQFSREIRIAERQARLEVMDPVQEVEEEYITEDKDLKPPFDIGDETNDSKINSGTGERIRDSKPTYMDWGNDNEELSYKAKDDTCEPSRASRSRVRRNMRSPRIQRKRAESKANMKGYLKADSSYIKALEAMSHPVQRNISNNTLINSSDLRSKLKSEDSKVHSIEPDDMFTLQNEKTAKRRKRVSQSAKCEGSEKNTFCLDQVPPVVSVTQPEKVQQKQSKYRKTSTETKAETRIPISMEDTILKGKNIPKSDLFGIKELMPKPDEPAEIKAFAIQDEPLIQEEPSFEKSNSHEPDLFKASIDSVLQESREKDTDDSDKIMPFSSPEIRRESAENTRSSRKIRKTREAASPIPKSSSYSPDDLESFSQSISTKDDEPPLVTYDPQAGDAATNRTEPSELSTKKKATALANVPNTCDLSVDGVSYQCFKPSREYERSPSPKPVSFIRREGRKRGKYATSLRKQISKYLGPVSEKSESGIDFDAPCCSKNVINYPDLSGKKRTRKKV